jgi:hypothetical protein
LCLACQLIAAGQAQHRCGTIDITRLRHIVRRNITTS